MPEFRFVTSQNGIKASSYTQYAIPKDIADISRECDVNKLADVLSVSIDKEIERIENVFFLDSDTNGKQGLGQWTRSEYLDSLLLLSCVVRYADLNTVTVSYNHWKRSKTRTKRRCLILADAGDDQNWKQNNNADVLHQSRNDSRQFASFRYVKKLLRNWDPQWFLCSMPTDLSDGHHRKNSGVSILESMTPSIFLHFNTSNSLSLLVHYHSRGSGDWYWLWNRSKYRLTRAILPADHRWDRFVIDAEGILRFSLGYDISACQVGKAIETNQHSHIQYRY